MTSVNTADLLFEESVSSVAPADTVDHHAPIALRVAEAPQSAELRPGIDAEKPSGANMRVRDAIELRPFADHADRFVARCVLRTGRGRASSNLSFRMTGDWP